MVAPANAEGSPAEVVPADEVLAGAAVEVVPDWDSADEVLAGDYPV